MNQNVVEKINEKEKGDVEYFSEKVLVSVARRNKQKRFYVEKMKNIQKYHVAKLEETRLFLVAKEQ